MVIDNWGIFEVTRDQVVFRNITGHVLEPTNLTEILPFGTFEGESVKQIILKNYIYFTYFRIHADQGNGIVIVIDTSKNSSNLMNYIQDLKNVLENKDTVKGPLILNESYSQAANIKIKDFDTAIFSFLTKKRMVIVGDENDVFKIIYSLFSVVPITLRNTLEFVTHSASLTENVNIIGMPHADDILRELFNAKGSYTIVFSNDRSYGSFTSKSCKKISQMLENGNIEDVKKELNMLFQLAQTNSDMPSALDFAKQNNLHLSDAQLILIMRAIHFGKTIPNNLLESFV